MHAKGGIIGQPLERDVGGAKGLEAGGGREELCVRTAFGALARDINDQLESRQGSLEGRRDGEAQLRNDGDSCLARRVDERRVDGERWGPSVDAKGMKDNVLIGEAVAASLVELTARTRRVVL
jgi:hypothetical protein